MPSLASRVASEPPTFSDCLTRCTSDTISTHPLLILVGMLSACMESRCCSDLQSKTPGALPQRIGVEVTNSAHVTTGGMVDDGLDQASLLRPDRGAWCSRPFLLLQDTSIRRTWKKDV